MQLIYREQQWSPLILRRRQPGVSTGIVFEKALPLGDIDLRSAPPQAHHAHFQQRRLTLQPHGCRSQLTVQQLYLRSHTAGKFNPEQQSVPTQMQIEVQLALYLYGLGPGCGQIQAHTLQIALYGEQGRTPRGCDHLHHDLGLTLGESQRVQAQPLAQVGHIHTGEKLQGDCLPLAAAT